MNIVAPSFMAATGVLLVLSVSSASRRLDLGVSVGSSSRTDPDLASRLGRTRPVRWVTRWERTTEPPRPELSKTAGYAVLAAAGLLLLTVLTRDLLLFVLAFPVLQVPSWLGSRKSRARKRAVDREIPQLLDLLAAASTGGLAAPLALRRCVEPLRGPLAEEIRSSLRAVDLGRRWSEEMAALAVRLDLPDLKRTVTLLTRTETLGTSLAQSVSDLADQVRSERRGRRTERARAAPVKMLFPLVFLVLPAFLLLTVVPVFLTTLRSI